MPVLCHRRVIVDELGRTNFACDRGGANDAPTMALLDELDRRVLVAEEDALDVDVDHPIQNFRRYYISKASTPSEED